MTGFFEVERQRHGKTTCFGSAEPAQVVPFPTIIASKKKAKKAA